MANYRSVSRNRLDAEKRIASFVIYYDEEQLTIFFDSFLTSVMQSEFTLTTNMSSFISAMKEIFENRKDLLNNGSDNWYPEVIINQILTINQIQETSEKNKEAFEVWIDSIKEMLSDKKKQDLFILGEECCDFFYWQCFKDKVQTIDNSQKSFKEKLEIKLPEINSASTNSKIIKLSDVTQSTFERSIYTTGVGDIDNYINLQPTNLMYVAARPSVGKSMFVANMAIANAMNGVDSLYLSLEMTATQTKSRILSWIKDGEVEESEIKELEATEEYRKINEHFWMLEADSMNGDIIYSIMDSFLVENPKGLVFLDSLNLVRYTGEDEWGSLRHISRDCKKLCLKNKGIIIGCIQATRESETMGLSLNTLFGGSTLEMDADIIVGLEPSSKGGSSISITPTLAKILKNRDGIKDVDVDLKLKKSTMHFYDSSDSYE
jgi:KaiC/GvpD/RAD55 family RecA-like ATPase